VIIPVRNRRATIPDAVKSALSQETDFAFNVIVVDNHSEDGTTMFFSRRQKGFEVESRYSPRMDLGIGGCWNEALQHGACGRYAVQLDSDDLYSSRFTLQKMVQKIRQGKYALVIGAYTLVNERLEEMRRPHRSSRMTEENVITMLFDQRSGCAAGVRHRNHAQHWISERELW